MYLKKINQAFTLVELIVVLTILAILSTLGFVAYTDYLKSVRDSSRIQQMTKIYDSLNLYGVRSTLPIPGDGVSVSYGGINVGIQGYADISVLDAIKFSDGGLDPKTKQSYTYFMSNDRKSSQILGYFEEKTIGNLSVTTPVVADDNYSILNPQVIGDELGVLIEESSFTPVQEILSVKEARSIDIESYTGSLISLISNSVVSTGTGTELISIVPNQSCKGILDTLGSAQSGLYKINVTNTQKTEVYCDMETDGGGWTFGAFISGDASVYDVFFNAETGNYSSLREESVKTYSLDLSKLYHTEMLITYNQPDIDTANTTNNLLRFKYDIFTPGFYLGPLYLANGAAFFGSGGDDTGLSYGTSTTSLGTLVPTNRDRFGTVGWGIGSNNPDINYIIRIATGNGGVYKYPETWGDTGSSSTGNSAYIYVR